MIDARDVGEVAAIELNRREQSATPLPIDRINLVGPDTLTGADAAAIWSDVLGRTILRHRAGEEASIVRLSLMILACCSARATRTYISATT